MGKKLILVLVTIIATVAAFIPSTKSSCSKSGSTVCASETDATDISDISNKTEEFDFKDVPEYNDSPYVIINGDQPYFKESDYNILRDYGELDDLGRTTRSIATVSKETVTTEDRSDIGFIKPSGWVQKKYEGVVDSAPPYLLNRSHLILYYLQGNCSNVIENLISATRYCNYNGFLPNEKEIINYVMNSDNHVLIRATPYYKDDELMCRGILYEAESIEDNGKSLHMCRWIYNVQPGVVIDYSTGDSHLEE